MDTTYADALLALEEQSFTDSNDALVVAQNFASEHGVKIYVLQNGTRGFRLSDQFDHEDDIADEALPD